MSSFAGVVAQKAWQYSLDSESQGWAIKADLDHDDIEVVSGSSSSSISSNSNSNSVIDSSSVASGSSSRSSFLERFVPFPAPVGQGSKWALNADHSVISYVSGDIASDPHVTLVELGQNTDHSSEDEDDTSAESSRTGFWGLFHRSKRSQRQVKSIPPRHRSFKSVVGEIKSIFFSPTDPNMLVVSTESSVRSIEKRGQITLLNIEPHRAISASPGPYITAPSVELDLTSGANILDQVYGVLPPGSETSNVFAIDGDKFLYIPRNRVGHWRGGEPNRNVAIYDMAEKEIIAFLEGNNDEIVWMGFSPFREWIVTVAKSQYVRLWNPSGVEIEVWDTGLENVAAQFSPDQLFIVVSCADGTVISFAIGTGEQVWYIPPSDHVYTSLEYSPDSQYLALGCESNGRASIVDLESPVNEDGTRDVFTFIPGLRGGLWQVVERHVPGSITSHNVRFIHAVDLHLIRDNTAHLVGFSSRDGSDLQILDMDTGRSWQLGSESGELDEEEDRDLPPSLSSSRHDTPGHQHFNTRRLHQSLGFDFAEFNEDTETETQAEMLGWEYLSELDQIMTIHSDGVRYWKFE
ncbi:WD40-repeat-containing domain protein [Kockovaella imperatae]|uniref:WD40-repeat-containing domain protein n=1 Tax=Kockovaella imperatae TaxID=4999 RepID=A0A1Y1UQI1_9TREE|nr:WD40-repeat-containing domain protein [Kockovaella imperatae]ORX40301.1 WD40-repeat-containing domain protein [Kockovaella imperatae]